MTVLGKRKASQPNVSEIDANELLRRHFEARFQPLEEKPFNTKGDDDNDDEDEAADSSEEGSEWGGFSEDDDEDNEDHNSENESTDSQDSPTVEIVDHSKPQLPKQAVISKRELKAFMSSRPPDQTNSSQDEELAKSSSKSTVTALPEDAPSLLAQDLELRRLLAESHLLAPHHAASKSLSSVSSNIAQPKLFADGRTRQKATDLRVQALGSKLSIHKQEKMPMNMRKGKTAAAEAREAKRRREAKENGIILERETGGKKRRRDRGREGGVDRPGVGRFKGAELRISEGDVKKIEGTRDTFGRRGRR